MTVVNLASPFGEFKRRPAEEAIIPGSLVYYRVLFEEESRGRDVEA